MSNCACQQGYYTYLDQTTSTLVQSLTRDYRATTVTMPVAKLNFTGLNCCDDKLEEGEICNLTTHPFTFQTSIKHCQVLCDDDLNSPMVLGSMIRPAFQKLEEVILRGVGNNTLGFGNHPETMVSYATNPTHAHNQLVLAIKMAQSYSNSGVVIYAGNTFFQTIATGSGLLNLNAFESTQQCCDKVAQGTTIVLHPSLGNEAFVIPKNSAILRLQEWQQGSNMEWSCVSTATDDSSWLMVIKEKVNPVQIVYRGLFTFGGLLNVAGSTHLIA